MITHSDDYRRMAEIWLAASLRAHDFVPAAYWESNLDAMRTLYLPAAENYAFVRDGQIAGFISLVGDRIEALFVDPACQGAGVGTALLEHARILRPRLTLAVYEENEHAGGFYRRAGFTVTGRRIEEATGRYELLMEWRADFAVNSVSP